MPKKILVSVILIIALLFVVGGIIFGKHVSDATDNVNLSTEEIHVQDNKDIEEIEEHEFVPMLQ